MSRWHTVAVIRFKLLSTSLPTKNFYARSSCFSRACRTIGSDFLPSIAFDSIGIESTSSSAFWASKCLQRESLQNGTESSPCRFTSTVIRWSFTPVLYTIANHTRPLARLSI